MVKKYVNLKITIVSLMELVVNIVNAKNIVVTSQWSAILQSKALNNYGKISVLPRPYILSLDTSIKYELGCKCTVLYCSVYWCQAIYNLSIIHNSMMVHFILINELSAIVATIKIHIPDMESVWDGFGRQITTDYKLKDQFNVKWRLASITKCVWICRLNRTSVHITSYEILIAHSCILNTKFNVNWRQASYNISIKHRFFC